MPSAPLRPLHYSAFRALIPGQFVNGAVSVKVPNPSLTGFDILDRYVYVSSKYDLHFDERWVSLGYLTCFIAAFFIGAAIGTRYVRHIVR